MTLTFLFLHYFLISSFQFPRQPRFSHGNYFSKRELIVPSESRLFLSQTNNHDEGKGVKLHILARDLKLTEALEARVQNKVGKVLEKLGKDIVSANVVLRIHRYPLTGTLYLSLI